MRTEARCQLCAERKRFEAVAAASSFSSSLTCFCLLCKLCMRRQNAAPPVGLRIVCLHAAASDKQMMCSPQSTAITASGPLQLAAAASSADFGCPARGRTLMLHVTTSCAPGAGCRHACTAAHFLTNLSFGSFWGSCWKYAEPSLKGALSYPGQDECLYNLDKDDFSAQCLPCSRILALAKPSNGRRRHISSMAQARTPVEAKFRPEDICLAAASRLPQAFHV